MSIRSSHDQPAGGRNAQGEWLSSRAAAYPAEFNYYLARAIHSLKSDTHAPSPLSRATHVPQEDSIETRAEELKLPQPPKPPSEVRPPPPTLQTYEPTLKIADCTACGDTGYVKGEPCEVCEIEKSEQARRLDFSAEDNEPRAVDVAPPKRHKVQFERGLGPLPVRGDGARERKPTKFFDPADGRRPSRDTSFRALHAKPSLKDPKNRAEALKQDEVGWTASERKVTTSTTVLSASSTDRNYRQDEKLCAGRGCTNGNETAHRNPVSASKDAAWFQALTSIKRFARPCVPLPSASSGPSPPSSV